MKIDYSQISWSIWKCYEMDSHEITMCRSYCHLCVQKRGVWGFCDTHFSFLKQNFLFKKYELWILALARSRLWVSDIVFVVVARLSLFAVCLLYLLFVCFALVSFLFALFSFAALIFVLFVCLFLCLFDWFFCFCLFCFVFYLFASVHLFAFVCSLDRLLVCLCLLLFV